MRKGRGINGSFLAVVMGILVGTSILVQDLRSRELTVARHGASYTLDKPRQLASQVDPQAFIPGFTPEEDAEAILRILEEHESNLDRRPPERTVERPRLKQILAQQRPRPAVPSVAKAEAVSEQADPRLSLRDLEELKQQLFAYAELQGSLPADQGTQAEIQVATTPELRTVATFLVMKPTGPRVLVCVRDKFGTQVWELQVSTEITTRIAKSAPPPDAKPLLLLLQKFLAP